MFTALKKHWGGVVVFGGVVTLIVGGAMFLTADHWWKMLSGASVSYKGQNSADSEVYRSRDGNILIRLEEEGGPSFYLVYPGREIVGMADPTRFVFLPRYAYSKEMPAVYVRMQSAKIEVDPQLIVRPHIIEFNSFERGRVRVAW